MTSYYKNKMLKKNKEKYKLVDEIYIGDTKTKISTSGDGIYSITTPTSSIYIDAGGNIHIKGNVIFDDEVEIKGTLNAKKLSQESIDNIKK